MDFTEQMLFSPLIYALVLIGHILSSCIAVGSVAVTDYLHLVGLRRHSLEKKIIIVYPFLTQIINVALVLIWLTGILLIINKPAILDKVIFQIEIVMVVIVTINGYILQKIIAPHIDKLITHNMPFSEKTLLQCSLCGAISVVTWFSVLILALTRNVGYSWKLVIPIYLFAIVFVFTVAQFVERKAHGRYAK